MRDTGRPGGFVLALAATVAGMWAALAMILHREYFVPGAYWITEWQMFYPGHFMRRGLPGSTLAALRDTFGLSPTLAALVLCALAMGAMLAIWSTRLFGYLWADARGWLLPLVLSPAGAFFWLNSPVTMADNLDVFFILITLGHLSLALRPGAWRTYAFSALALFGILGSGLVLCPEAFAFCALPVNAVITYRRLGANKKWLAAIYAGPMIATLACVLYPGTEHDSTTLSGALRVADNASTPVGALQLSLPEAMHLVGRFLFSSSALPMLLALLLFGGFHLAVMRRLVQSSEPVAGPALIGPRGIWHDYLLVPAICTIPLYALGTDYGRWLTITVTLFTFCVVRLTRLRAPVRTPPLAAQVVLVAIFLTFSNPGTLSYKATGKVPLASRFRTEAQSRWHRPP